MNDLNRKRIWLTTTEIQEPLDVDLTLILNVFDMDTLYAADTL